MEYNIVDKMNMSIQRLRQEQTADFVNNLSDDAEIVHRSLWAVSIKDGLHLFKLYYYDAPEKINKEVILLQNMGQISIQLYKDNKGFYYSKAAFLELESISNGNCSFIFEQLDFWFEKWNKREEFILHASKNWKTETVPYMTYVLSEYGDDAERYIEYIKGLQEEVFIHGDFTLDNVKKSGEKIIILDFETAAIGPKLWDKTTFVYSLIENGCYNLGIELFNYFKCDKQLLECIAAVRLAIAKRKNKNITQRDAAYYFIQNMKKER